MASPSSFSSPLVSTETISVTMADHDANLEKAFPDNSIKTSRYTVLTFLPLNLLEQFRRMSNFYFLLVMIVSLVPGATPINPATAVAPLVFVLAVACCKDAYEDYKRHQSDFRANSIEADVWRDGEFTRIRSADIEPGDIIKIKHGEEIRADCVLLNSSLADGLCYIETANLDGETNVKTKKSKPFTVENVGTVEQIEALKKAGSIQMVGATPTPSLASWKGQLVVDDVILPLSLEQFLFRGAVVRNTEWCLAAVLYTGVNTKMFLNLQQKPAKFSLMDEKVNRVVVLFFVLNEIIIFLLCGFSVHWTEVEKHDNDHVGAWYLRYHLYNIDGVRLYFWRYLTYFVLLSFMIPISLFVTLELNKAAQLLLISWDEKMSAWHKPTKSWRFCRPKTSNLNHQLAHVTSIFSDKTGTLTENCMDFKGGYVDGREYVSADRHHIGDALKHVEFIPSEELGTNGVFRYLAALSLCHSVVSFEDEDDKGFVYEGQSPDEVALVNAAAENGFVLIKRSSTQLIVEMQNVNRTFDVIAELDFSAERKMMSMIVKPVGDGSRPAPCFLLTKGADSSVVPRLSPEPYNGQHKQGLELSLHEMAGSGLRTLVYGFRVIDENELSSWLPVFEDAQCSMGDRHAELHEAYALIEKDFTLVGSTAVEDKLQDFVPETISFLLDANIVVWMLTGDKRETAVTIGATSGLINPHTMTVAHIDVSDLPQTTAEEFQFAVDECSKQLTEVLESCTSGPTAMVVDGVSLNCVFGVNDAKTFLEVGGKCKSAICCRLTPLQKADVVKLFQSANTGVVMAIGDGANDVSMIQEGKLGIGVMGLEGAQAELASDYAVARFHHIRRLLFVHGRNCYFRDAQAILYSFYKNFLLSVTMICFTTYSGFSGISIYDSWLLAAFNMFFCSLPPLSIGMYDKDISDDVAESQPQLYGPLAEGEYFDAKAFSQYLFDVIGHGVPIYFVAHQLMVTDDMSWRSSSLDHYGTLLFIMVVCAIDIRAAMIVSRWDIIQVIAIGVSFLMLPCFLLVYSAFESFGGENWMVDVSQEVFSSSQTYLHILFVLGGLVTVVNLSLSHFMATELPSQVDRVRRTLSTST